MSHKKDQKRVILMIVDALTSRYFFPALESGKLPNFAHLTKGGTVRRESFSIFPSLTPAATSTIVTGKEAKEHNIFGFHWFNRSSGEVAYYGDDFWTIATMGFAEFFNGCLCQLNQERLSAETIFEKLHKRGKTSASLNFLIFQGGIGHLAQVPLWFSWHPDVPFAKDIVGPDMLFFGDFVDSSYKVGEDSPSRSNGLFGRFGFNDDNTGSLLKYLAREDAFPDFTLAYFPDHDYNCHEVGPEKGFETVYQVDQVLGEVFDCYGGPEQALEKLTFVVTGDHSQSDVLDDAEQAGILVKELFDGFRFTNAHGWEENEVLKVFPDMRCAQVYFRHPGLEFRDRVVAKIREEARVDQVIWRDQTGYTVTTSDRGSLRFWQVSEDESQGRDVYGAHWDWEGDLCALDASCRAGIVEFGDYPNAFERIVGALEHPDSGDLWLTAKLGYEFTNNTSEIHLGGGSHGSLHREDSESPLIVSGVDLADQLAECSRLVDVEPICLHLLGVASMESAQSRREIIKA